MFTHSKKLTRNECIRLLGVDDSAGLKEIKRAFRKQVRRLHPDLNPGQPELQKELQRVIGAYHYLTDSTPTRHRSELADIFRKTGGGQEKSRQMKMCGLGQVRSRFWAAAGVLAGIFLLILRGGPSALFATPATHWSFAAFCLGGAWVSVRLFAPAGRFRTGVLALSLAAGALAGVLAGYGFITTLDQFMYDAAKVWFALASGAAGGLAGTLHHTAIARDIMGPAFPG
mgnify:FL=1